MGHAEAGIWGWLGLMLAIMCANNLVTTWRDHRRASRQLSRLKLALRMELIQLQQIYSDNLRLINQEKGYVISGKSFVTVIRGNLERITTLEEGMIEPVIAVFSHNERIEALVAGNGKPSGGAAYRLDFGKVPLNEIRRSYQIGRQRVNAALAALGDEPSNAANAAKEGDAASTTAAEGGAPKPVQAIVNNPAEAA